MWLEPHPCIETYTSSCTPIGKPFRFGEQTGNSLPEQNKAKMILDVRPVLTQEDICRIASRSQEVVETEELGGNRFKHTMKRQWRL